MIKVFISYSMHDKKFVEKLSKDLQHDDVLIWRADNELPVGENISEKIKEAISKTDYFIVVLSKQSVSSKWVNFEISATLITEITKQQIIILPILIEDCEIPFSLRDRLYADFRHSFQEGYNKLIYALKQENTRNYLDVNKVTDKNKSETYEFQIKSLKEEYNIGNLTLFCGAGISFDACIPTWNTLLKSLLKEVYSDKTDVPDIDNRLANLFQKRINVSPLILAQYLKTLLGKKFTLTVREALYRDCTYNSKTINAIAELSRPRRERKPLKAIITFNFDDLIEDILTKEKIEYKSIFSEGERFCDKQIPIYHPHGYLPRTKNLSSKNEIVFSEDAYHSQFIDPFSWSNLVQLNHLNNNTCLFVGISLTDPNMRRLLDVSIRKNGKGEKNHYIIKKHYKLEDLYPEIESENSKDIKVIPVIENIEEQDANNFGFNVIWINDFKEISEILLEIGK